MNIWLVTREYAGIAEAGGVKNVSCSLSETLAKLGHNVCVFMPEYGCTDSSRLEDFTEDFVRNVDVDSCGRSWDMNFSRGSMNGVEIVLVRNPIFKEKKSVYTYTRDDESENPSHRHGEGHFDALLMNTIFQKAVVEYGLLLDKRLSPQIVHCQDAATALVPVFIEYRKSVDGKAKEFYCSTKSLVTIHNAGPGYHHQFQNIDEAAYNTSLPRTILEGGLNGGCVEPFLLAEKCSCTTTVSPQYADEILSEKTDTAGLSRVYRERGTRIIGITNGIDISRYTPKDTESSLLPYAFDPEAGQLEGKELCRKYLLDNFAMDGAKESLDGIETYGYIDTENEFGSENDLTYIAYHGRVVWQKGINVLAKSVDTILSKKLPVRFIFIGQGQPDLEKELLQLALRYEGKCIYFRGYDRFLSRLCMASADIAIFPSYFEPCGLEDLIAQIFGTIPLAHATGGLCKIHDDETGFLYMENTPEKLTNMMEALIKIKYRVGADVFSKMIIHTAKSVRENFTWEQVTQTKYIPLYERLLKGDSL